MKNQKGFSLVEMLIVAGLVAVIASQTSSMFTTIFKQNAKQNALMDLQSDINTLYSVFSNQSTCNTALSGKTYDPTHSLPQDVQGGIVFNDINYSVGQKKGSLTVESVQWVAPDTTLGTSSVTIGGATVSITSHLANIQIGFVDDKGNHYKKTLTFMVGIDPSKNIRNCFSSIDGGSVCTQLGGFMSGGRCQMPLNIDDTITIGASCSPNGLTSYSTNNGPFFCHEGEWTSIKIITKCDSMGGTPITSPVTVCKFPGSSCPAGTTKLANWTTTNSTTCWGGSTSGCNSGGSCDTGEHGWSNHTKESCVPRKNIACGPATEDGATCYATITEIGCTIN